MNIILARLEAFEEGEKRVGWSVAAGLDVGRSDAFEGASFEFHVGVEVFVRCLESLVAEP